MPPARKSRRQARPPAKLDEFFCEDGRDREQNEPRRSRRTPKLSEKLINYMHDKGNVKKERSDYLFNEQAKTSSTGSSETESSSLKDGEPRVLGRLSSHVMGKTRRTNKSSSETKVSVKRLANSSARKKDKTAKTTSLAKRRVGMASSSRAKSADSYSSAKRTRRVTKRKLEAGSSSKEGKTFGTYKKFKHVRDSISETENKSTKAKEGIDKVPLVNKNIINKLLNFGAEVAEAMSVNNETMLDLSANDSTRQNPLRTLETCRVDDFDEDEITKIINWLEEEEEQRRTHRKRILDSMKVSHESNMALYTQMLQVLQSVTSSA
nr:uncharacterized protein LOC128698790 [Cherax quadricarinatus]XP_053647151.1 uncharacterized protein LOC128698790 [Cherax quadricarinatus]